MRGRLPSPDLAFPRALPMHFGIKLCRLMVSLLLGTTPLLAAEFHVSTDGKPTNDGSSTSPWDLSTALAQPVAVRPGDTIWLAAGTYSGTFASRLTGETGRPIIVRAMLGKRVTIDCQPVGDRPAFFTVDGAYVRFQDLEVMCSHPRRVTTQTGPWPTDINRGGLFCRASHAQFINLVVHDTLTGFGFWSEGEAGEIYGSIIYNNGWQAPDRSHGHGIYVQNLRGRKQIVDNCIFNQFGYGIHAYGSAKASLRGLDVEGNVMFNNGLWSEKDRAPNLLVGGAAPAGDIRVVDNVMYQSQFAGTSVQLGYGVPNDDILFQRNYTAGFMRVLPWKQMTVDHNTIVGLSSLVELHTTSNVLSSGIRWDHNTYLSGEREYSPLAAYADEKPLASGWPAWQMKTGLDANSRYVKGPPQGVEVFVRPNQYEPGRALVAIFNWDEQPEVEVDLSQVLKAGQRYRIVSAQNFYGPDVDHGRYDGGKIKLRRGETTIALPIGMEDRQPPAVDKKFGAFVVLRDAMK